MKLAKETALYNEGAVEAVNEKAELAEIQALEALQIAGNTDQYFWHTETGTDTGAHITEIPQADFITNPENGGGNLLARSNGIAVRDGLTELAIFSASGSRIGLETAYHTQVESDGFAIMSGNETIFSAGTSVLFSPNLSGGQLLVFCDDSSSDYTMNAVVSDMSQRDSATRTASATKGSVAIGGEVRYLDISTSDLVYIFTEASGEHSLAIGKGAVASGDESSAHGIGVVAGQTAQFVVGKYNDNKTDTLFEVGNGVGDTSRANAFAVDQNGNVVIAGTLTQSSDRRLKKHVAYLDEDAVELIRKLKQAHFVKDEKDHVGFYAQDVEKEDKWNCMTGEMNGYMTLGYTEIIAPLVAYCQHLEARIDELERKQNG